MNARRSGSATLSTRSVVKPWSTDPSSLSDWDENHLLLTLTLLWKALATAVRDGCRL